MRVFIAHSKMQADRARMLQQALSSFGYLLRLDLIDMSVGKAEAEVRSEICAAFKWATHIVVLATSEYVSKSSRYCRFEIEWLAKMSDSRRRFVLVLKDRSALKASVFMKELSAFETLDVDVSNLDPNREVQGRSLVCAVVQFLDR